MRRDALLRLAVHSLGMTRLVTMPYRCGHIAPLCLCLLTAFACVARAETIIDDFSTPHPAFGDVNSGNAVFDVVISGAGIATSRDGLGQSWPPGAMALPGSVAGGVFHVTQLGGPSHSLFLQYDAHGDGVGGAMPTMPGGPYDVTGLTEFRIDVSGLSGSLYWYVAVGDALGSASGSPAISLVNGVNTLPVWSNLAYIDLTSLSSLQLGIINYSNAPSSVDIHNFRMDVTLVPEPASLGLLVCGFAPAVLRRFR